MVYAKSRKTIACRRAWPELGHGVSAARADHRPVDGFITADGARLHYFEKGTGAPVVFLHGNGSMIGDFVSSGITERAANTIAS